MKIIFALYKYFPFGGLQKDMLAIAQACAERGHTVDIFCQSWEGDHPTTSAAPNLKVNILPFKSRLGLESNHKKNLKFALELQGVINKIQPDIVVGFNKIPGIDIYYAADTSFKAKLYRERPWLFRLLPRYRQFICEEAQIFDVKSCCHVLAISQPAIDEYQDFYDTPSERFSLLPPGVSKDRINSSGQRLYRIHEELKLTEDKLIVLMVGSGFRTKGLDRAINALAALPEEIKKDTHLVVVGKDNKEIFKKQAKQQNVDEQVHFFGGRKDIPQILQSADVLIHPAYRENTGTVLLEAAVACLPVLATDSCGYSHYVTENGFGMVMPSPFKQQELNQALLQALTDTEQIKAWRKNAQQFAKSADIYNMPGKAADIIERNGTKQIDQQKERA